MRGKGIGNKPPGWTGQAPRHNLVRLEQRPASKERATGNANGDVCITPLIQLLGDEREEVRVIAAYSLAESGKAVALEAVLGAAARGRLSKGPELMLILTIMAETSLDLVRKLLEHTDKIIRQAAVNALINSGRRDAAGCLLALLGDGEPAIRAAAAKGLGQLRYGQAKEELRRLLRDEWWEVKASAAWALRELKIGRGLTGWQARGMKHTLRKPDR